MCCVNKSTNKATGYDTTAFYPQPYIVERRKNMNKICEPCGRILPEETKKCPECGGDLKSFDLKKIGEL